MQTEAISAADLNWVATRSFLVQGLWNYEKLQNLGWAWTVQPALQKIYPDPQQRRAALKRHMEYFNTHPYVAGPILGTTLRLEQDLSARGEDPAPQVAAVKSGMMGPLAALGDVFFWATVRPLPALVGVSVFFLAGAGPLAALSGCLALLALVNLPHLVSRYQGPHLGFERGLEMIDLLRRVDIPSSVARAYRVGLVLVAAVLAGLGRFRYPGVEVSPLEDNILYMGFGALMLVAMRFKVSAVKVLFLLLGLAMLAAYLEPHTTMGS